MSFGAGMGAGFAAGMGSGIAIGISSGKKRACRELLHHLTAEGITLHGRDGKPLDSEQVINHAVKCGCDESSKLPLLVLLGVGLVVLLSVLATIFVWQSSLWPF